VFLVDNLDAKYSGLVGELYQAGILSAEERDTISSDVMSFTQNEKLLSMLSRKTKEQFDKFLDALDKTGQQHVRNIITGRQGHIVEWFGPQCLSVLSFLPCDAMRCTVFVIVILSVRLSVCHTRGLCLHGSTYDHDFFTIW